ncbi:cilia- and flagella-associated protein 57-like isoform X2 [Tachysurus fulvidraco]|uniref:cilia- and flagella-associated protein 57-like isoform X2 n=1 Tax=Tachysurus fulvidraco TaxID=1234273 RepID=UPI001FED3A24|nr:cilia- and flagella-associated protein 57-like isoform X2 [Tachysurus fulvidraco]
MAKKFQLDPHHIFGLCREVNDNLHFLEDHIIIFPSGKYCVRYNLFHKCSTFIPVAKESEGIQALAMSPNRHYLAVSERGKQGRIIIYDLQNQECTKRQVLTGGKISVGNFVCMAFSSDSKYLLGQTEGPDWTLFYWEWDKNKVNAHEKITRISSVNQVSFNPIDNTQVCVNGKGVFKTFKLEHGNLNQSIVLNTQPDIILCHTWMSGDCIVAGTDTGKLLLLKVKSGRKHELGRPYESTLHRQMENTDTDAMASIFPHITAITRYSRGFVCSVGPGLIFLYEKMLEKNSYRKTMEIRIPQEPCLQQSQAEQQEITSICMSPEEDNLAVTTDKGQIYHANLELNEVSQIDEVNFKFLFHSLHTGSITDLSVCVSRPFVATCSKDKSVCIWNFETKSLELYKRFPQEPHCMALDPHGFSILVGFSDRLCLMSLLVDKFQTVKEFPTGSCTQCVFSHDGNTFAAVSIKVILIYNVRTQKKVELRGHRKEVLSVKWNEDDSRLLSCGMDGAICVWNVLTGVCESYTVQETCIYRDVMFSSASGNVLAVGSDFKLKEFHNQQILMELASDGVNYTAICMPSSGKAVFVGTATGSVRVMQYPLQEEEQWTEYQAHSSSITKMVITPGDRFLLTASEDGSLLIWRVTDDLGRNLCIKGLKYTGVVLCGKSYLEEKEKNLEEANHQLAWIKFEQEQMQDMKDRTYTHKLNAIERNYLRQFEEMKAKNEALTAEIERQKALLAEITVKHAKELEDEKRKYEKKLCAENESHWKMQQRLTDTLKANYEKKLSQQEECHNSAMRKMKRSHQDELLEQQAKFGETQKLIKCSVLKGIDPLEVARELENELDLAQQQVKRFDDLKMELRNRDATIHKLKEELKRMQFVAKKIKDLTMEKEAQIKTIGEQKNHILTLLAKLEKFNKGQGIDYFTLQKRLAQMRHERDNLKKLDLSKDVKQMQQKIDENKILIKELKAEAMRNNTMNKEIIEDLKKRLTLNDEELIRVRRMNTLVEKMKADIQRGSNFLDQPKMLKDHFIRLQKLYVLKTQNVQNLSSDAPRGVTKGSSSRVRWVGQAPTRRNLDRKNILGRGEGAG